MEVDVSKLELASVAAPDDADTRRRLHDLTHQDGVALTPAETYYAQDSSGCLRLTVDRDARVIHVGVAARWERKINPAEFGGTLFHTYTTALHRVALLESQRPAPTGQDRSASSTDRPWEPMSLPELVAKVNSELNAINDEYDRIRQVETSVQAPAQAAGQRQISSPRGSLFMTVQAHRPTAITGDVTVLTRLSADQLALDIQRLFDLATADVPASPTETPTETPRADAARQRPRRRFDDDHDDDDYFSNFSVLRDFER